MKNTGGFKVLIMSCSSSVLWYYKSVGKTYKVVNADSKNYMLKVGADQKRLRILKQDCVVIES